MSATRNQAWHAYPCVSPCVDESNLENGTEPALMPPIFEWAAWLRRSSDGRGHGVLAQHLDKIQCLDWPADQVSLNFVATLQPEEIQLILGFDPLGHHFKFQVMGQCDDRPRDRRILATLGQVADEGLVDFHVIHREAFEVAER